MIRSIARPALASLSVKLGATFVLAFLTAMIGMGGYAYVRARQNAVEHGLVELRLLSEGLATRIDRTLADGRSLVSSLANTRNVQAYLEHPDRSPADQAAFLAWLDLQAGQTSGLATIAILGLDGRCLAANTRSMIGLDLSARQLFQQAVTGSLARSDWIIGSSPGTPRLAAAAPVFLDGAIAGVLVTEFWVGDLEQATRAAGTRGLTAQIINDWGIALSHSDPALQYHSILPLSPRFAQGFHQVRTSGQAQTLSFRAHGAVQWTVLTPLLERPWVVAVAIPEAEILRPVRRALLETVLAGLVASLAGFFLALSMGRSLLEPIHQLSLTMARFGAGDIQVRAPVRSRDERGRLAQEFNAMADTIQTHREWLEDLVKVRTLDLERTMAEVRILRGMIPICSYCKKIRDDEGGWLPMEHYIRDHSEAQFSHGICPDCKRREFPELKGAASSPDPV